MKKLGWLIVGVVVVGAISVFLLSLHRGSGQHSVTLSWKSPPPSNGPKVIGYNIYRSTSSSGPYARVASEVKGPTYKDELVNSGTTYYYVVKSVNESGIESQPSEEIRVTVPDP
jgi:fibronectin type 3 domain-containing protein